MGDRESDIYELFCVAEEQHTNFLFRTCVDRVAGDGEMLVSEILARTPVKGCHCLTVEDKQGNTREAVLEVKFKSLIVHPPEYKKKFYPELKLTVLEARERKKPKKGEQIVWKLITNLPVFSLRSAIEKLEWYAMRWKIETFHKILKREAPEGQPSLAFTKTEIRILRQRNKAKTSQLLNQKYSVDSLILQVAKLGGYLARANDPPPGNLVIWRGLARLSDIQLGFEMNANICG